MTAFACILAGVAPAFAADIPGSKDPPGFKRFQGSEIVYQDNRAYDEYVLARGPGSAGEGFAKSEKIEGAVSRLLYRVPDGHTSLELLRNYEQMLASAGYAQTFELKTMSWDNYFYSRFYDQNHTHDDNHYLKNVKNPMYFTAKATKGGQDINVAVLVVECTGETWAYADKKIVIKPGEILVALDVVTSKAVGNKMVELKATDMARLIDSTGKVDVYGISFDVDKTVIRAESTGTLREVAKLLKDNPALKLLVAGHTDNSGTAEHNMKLSEGRAAAVVATLVTQHDIVKSRLQPRGFGDTQPVASNDTEEGRSRNRRVELRKI
jgi:outer membrane protein OmpA-like peptidoglycan-associated protein